MPTGGRRDIVGIVERFCVTVLSPKGREVQKPVKCKRAGYSVCLSNAPHRMQDIANDHLITLT